METKTETETERQTDGETNKLSQQCSRQVEKEGRGRGSKGRLEVNCRCRLKLRFIAPPCSSFKLSSHINPSVQRKQGEAGVGVAGRGGGVQEGAGRNLHMIVII